MLTSIEEKVQYINEKIEAYKIKIVYLNFPDMNGNIRTKGVLAQEIIRTVNISLIDGITVTGSIIEGFEKNNSYFNIVPILETFTVINLEKDEKYKSAFMLCSLRGCDMDSRSYVEKLVEIAEQIGLYPMAGMPLTYEIVGERETAGNDFYKLLPGSVINKFNINLINALVESGIDVESFIPYGKSHNGIEYVPQSLLKSIDQVALSKWIASSIAVDQSVTINYSRPMENSSPVHISIWDNEHRRNLFFDPEDELELSKYGYSFIAGILANFDEIFAVIISSAGKLPECKYKKAFSIKNDECVLSAPRFFVEKEKKDRVGWSKRCIFRGILPEANLYLTLACIYLTGVDGIKKKLDIKEYIDEDYTVFSSSIEEKIKKLKANTLLCDFLGDKMVQYIVSRLENLR